MTDDIVRTSKSTTSNRHVVIQKIEKTEEETESETYTPEEATNTLGVGLFQVKLIILSGFVWMARGFESVLLRSASAFQSCTWKLQRWQGALMLLLTELFTVLGCLLYGIWSDKYGRRTALSSSLIFSFVFAAVSAGLPNFTWFMVFRVVVGFAIGGMPQTLVLCCEYMPGSQRGRCVYILSCFWALGVIIMLSVLFLTLGNIANWRIFVAIGAFPAFLAMIMMRFFPESFRFLMVSNQYFSANEIISEVAESNQKVLRGHLKIVPKQRRRGKIADLFRYSYGRSTLLFCFLGTATAISFLGMTMISPFILLDEKEAILVESSTVDFMGNITSPIECLKELSIDEFIFSVWTTALDFPGFVIYIILVDLLDRKKLLCGSYILSSLFIFLLLIPIKNSAVLAAFVYGSRMLLVSQLDLLLLIAAETYPTTHRGTAVGTEAAAFYLGQIVSSYIAQALLSQHAQAPLVVYGIVVFICGIASIFLKHDSKATELQDSMVK